jgi:hypothetical protein
MTTVEQRDALIVAAYMQGTSITQIVMMTGMTSVEIEWTLRRELTKLSKK